MTFLHQQRSQRSQVLTSLPTGLQAIGMKQNTFPFPGLIGWWSPCTSSLESKSFKQSTKNFGTFSVRVVSNPQVVRAVSSYSRKRLHVQSSIYSRGTQNAVPPLCTRSSPAMYPLPPQCTRTTPGADQSETRKSMTTNHGPPWGAVRVHCTRTTPGGSAGTLYPYCPRAWG